MLHDLLVATKLDKLEHYRYVEASIMESACAELDVAQLEEILKKYSSVDAMFTCEYLHGTNQNIKLMVDMGKTVDAPETIAEVYDKLRAKEPLYFRLFVEVFKAYLRKTERLPTVSATVSDAVADAEAVSSVLTDMENRMNVADVLITDLKDQLTVKIDV
jgi:hypothetical protein